MTSDIRIRAMRPAELNLAADWAAAEGWNPGLADTSCFSVIDPAGFLIGDLDGKPAAIISCVNYDDAFAFLGFYIVRPDLRGRGFGIKIWRAALEHSGGRTVGLDGVLDQQDNYRKSGFALAYRNIRYGGTPHTAGAHDATVPLRDIRFDVLAGIDARCFPAARPDFLRAWIDAPGHIGRALVRDGQPAGWGVIRPARNGRKIGPLYAADRTAAEAIFYALVGRDEGDVFIDVPEPNHPAAQLAQAHGLEPTFETARMYTGPVGPIAIGRIFGVTTFEVG